MSNVTDVVAPVDQLQSSELHDLDLVTFLFGYHDTTYGGFDRTKMNKQLFDSLKPGGTLVIADHSARPEDGAQVGSTLRRTAQDTVRQEIEEAGFIFEEEGDFLRHPEDVRTEEIFKNPASIAQNMTKQSAVALVSLPTFSTHLPRPSSRQLSLIFRNALAWREYVNINRIEWRIKPKALGQIRTSI